VKVDIVVLAALRRTVFLDDDSLVMLKDHF
jgi:hypothetical protein